VGIWPTGVLDEESVADLAQTWFAALTSLANLAPR
jgi:hypothetical protein